MSRSRVKNLALVQADDNSVDSEAPSHLLRDQLGTQLNPSEVEGIVFKHVSFLESWAKENAKAASWDRFFFWTGKLFVLLGAGGTSVLAVYNLNEFATAAALLATIFNAIESVRPRGLLYKVHVRAANDLRVLSTWALTRWDEIRLLYPEAKSKERHKAVVDILSEIQKRRRGISEYLGGAEAQLGGGMAGNSIGNK